MNYVKHLNITFFIGFSRGAFTARSIGGVIANIGVMTKEGLHAFPVVYQASRMLILMSFEWMGRLTGESGLRT
jgi:uncharacterized protein (DUF2235 family)